MFKIIYHMAVRIIEICKLTPPESATESSLPLTFFDANWIKFHPVERIFFYELTTESSSSFSSILPKLKQSLSLSLLHFLPFAGKLVWPSYSVKPFILYTPGDGISLIVAESDADFDSVSGDTIREIPDSHHYLPELKISETEAETMSFQITIFPNRGFCIGISSHHSVFDGKSSIMFLKCWAHICKQTEKDNGSPTLPPQLTPFLDRTVINDSEGLDMVYLNHWTGRAARSGKDANARNLKTISMFRPTTDTNFVRGTFRLSGENINRIREKVVSSSSSSSSSSERGTNEANLKRYSTFVLAYAYISIAIVKAKGLDRKKKIVLIFAADVRARLDPPVPENYCGNCVCACLLQIEVASVIEEDGLAVLAEEFTQLVKKLDKRPLDGAKEKLKILEKMDPMSTEVIGVAGSPRFDVYGIDFGWGKPKKVELTSVDRGTSISMADRRDGKSGIEIGIALRKDEMKIFERLFLEDLQD